MAYLYSQPITFDLTKASTLLSLGSVRFYQDVPFPSVSRILSACSVLQDIVYSIETPKHDQFLWWQLEYGLNSEIRPNEEGLMKTVRVRGSLKYIGIPMTQYINEEMLKQSTFRANCVALCE